MKQWKRQIPRDEFIAWMEFYKLHPFDDYHRFYRPAAMGAAVASGAKVEELLAWLAREKPAHAQIEYTAADLATFKTFGMNPPGKH